MRQKTFRLRQLAVAAIAAITAISGIAVLGATPAGAAPTNPALNVTLQSGTANTVAVGGTNQAATNWTFTLANTFTAADAFTIDVGPNATTSCQSATNYVGFAAVPTVTATLLAGTVQSTSPAITASLATNSGDVAACAGIRDQLVLTIGNSANTTSGSQQGFTVAISGISYNVGSATPVGPLEAPSPIGTFSTYVQGPNTLVPVATVAPNATVIPATVSTVSVTANNPQVLLQPGLQGGSGTSSISPITLTETAAGSIPAASYVCIVLNKTPPLALQPYFVNTNLVPNGTVSVGSASGAVVGNSGALTQIGGLYSVGRTVTDGVTTSASKVVTSAMANFTSADVGRTVTGSGIPAGATIASVTNGTTIVLSANATLTATGVTLTFGNLGSLTQSTGFSFQVTTASTTAGTFTVSGLSVVGVLSPGNGTLTVYASSSAACTTANATYTTNTTAYSAFNANRIYGQVADGTAAALLESVFKPAGTTCPTGGNVVLATDQNFPDALSASYLAQGLKTGVLLTPTGSLSTDAAAALRVEGITHVYIVGGPIAVSTDVVNQLTATQAYNCGGTTGLITAAPGTPQNLTVTQVYGQTAYDTAQSVAQYFGASGVGSGSFATAYPTSTTGTSTYNATSGMSGTIAPANSAPTKVAIVATGENFPDAVAASALVYAQAWPVLLTQQASLAPQAAAAISNLGIQQVVVMGGPIAISDAVVTQLEGMGVSVLRIGGQDYTDTAQLLAQFELNSNGLNWSTAYPNLLIPLTYGVNVARGDFYADALTGSVVGGKTHTPIVLTFDPNTMGTGIPALLQAEASLKIQVTSLNIFGGPLAVSAATQLSVLLSISANSTI